MKRRLCHYCQQPMSKRGTHDPCAASVDHIIPKSRGGTNSPINKVMACRRCNNEKGNFTGVEYKAWKAAGKPNREVFKASLSEFKDRYLNNETDTHFEWFLEKYVIPPKFEPSEPTILSYEDNMFILKHGKEAYRQWIASGRAKYESSAP